jgi:hypothetical protein
MESHDGHGAPLRRDALHAGVSLMTPEKRSYLLKLFVICLTAAMIVGGYLSQDAWLPVVMGT